jgi:FkbM family methyltransferase
MASLMRLRRPRPLGDLFDAYITRVLVRRAGMHAARRGHKLAIFANDLIGIDINQFGLYEREELELLFEFLQPMAATFATGTALDIGANIGNHTLFFAPRFAQVHAFEPNPDTCALLRFNTQWSRNIAVHELGLGSEAGSFELNEHATNLGGSSLLNRQSSNDRQVSIRVWRLDELDLPLENLCFMKLDVEGFEAKALAGARAAIERSQPMIVLEQHLAEFRDGQPPAILMLRALGYRFAWHSTRAQPRHWLGRRWRNLVQAVNGQDHHIVTADEVEARHHSMLIAVPPRFQAPLGLD